MNVFKAFKLSAVAAVLVCTASAAFAAESEFSYAGYLRVGYAYTNGLYGYDGNFGLTGKDGGAQKWTGRLGKEANAQYLENTLMNTFTVEGGAWAKLFVTFTFESFNPGTDAQGCSVGDGSGIGSWSYSAGGQKNGTNILMRNRQAYVEMGGLGFSPDTSFWVGRRFYHRDDVHVLDYYVLDYSGDGAGVENIAGLGLSLGIISHPYIADGQYDISVDTTNKNDLTTNATNSDGTKDKGKYTFSTFVGQWKNKFIRVDGTYLYVPKNGEADARNGQTFSVQLKPEYFVSALKNTSVVAQYGRGGSAENLWFGNRYTKDSDHGKETNKKARSFVAMISSLVEIDDNFQIAPVVGFVTLHTTPDRAIGDATCIGTSDLWRIFAVVRPHYSITKNIAAEVELGYYSLNSNYAIKGGAASAAWNQGMGLEKGQKSNWEMKVTPALVLTLDRGFYTRPALRLFATYEQVGKKTTSNEVNYDKKYCVSYGFQVEAWW